MPTVGTKRQITLPSDECREVGLEPGDECDIFIVDGNITIIPQKPGISWKCLSHLKRDRSISDDQSIQDAIDRKHRRNL